jgi:hypothetical protein
VKLPAALGGVPDLLSCAHSGPGLASGILAFSRPPTVEDERINAMVALCPACTERVYHALKDIVRLRPP